MIGSEFVLNEWVNESVNTLGAGQRMNFGDVHDLKWTVNASGAHKSEAVC